MDSESLVTIVIPTYNQAEVLHKAIESALAQDYSALEVIVADDASPDNTQAVVQPYLGDPRFKYFRNVFNLGRVSNYKRALEKYARGEWVVNCDGDDYYTDVSFVSEVMARIAQHPDKSIVFAQAGQRIHFANELDRDYEVSPPIASDTWLLKRGQYFWQYPRSAYFSHLTTLYRREAAIGIDFYRYDIASSDRESFLRLALHGDVLLIKKVYGNWVQHETNFSQSLDFEIRCRNISYITGSYHYTRQMLGGSTTLEAWRKSCLTGYFKDWLSRIAIQKQPLSRKLKEMSKVIALAKTHQEKIWYSADFLKTIASLPYKLL